MSQTLRNSILSASSTNNTFTQSIKGDRFTNTSQNGVLGTRVGGTAPFVQRYIPAYLQCGSFAQTTPATWAAVTNGSFRMTTLDGTARNFDAIDFTGDTTMADVAATIQAKIRSVTGGLETCTWDTTTERFTISSVLESSSSEVSFLTTSTGTVGTDISGAGASAWMAGTAAYFAQVAPVQFIEGYTPYTLTPTGGLAPFYEFNGNLNSSSGGSALTASGDAIAYTSFGSPAMGAVYTTGTEASLTSVVTFPSGAFEICFRIRMDDLPASGKTALLFTGSTTGTPADSKILITVSDAGVVDAQLNDPAGVLAGVTLSGGSLSADTNYQIRVVLDPTLTTYAQEASLFINESLVDDENFPTDVPNFSAVDNMFLFFGTDDITGAPPNFVGIDGYVMNFGIFGELQATSYWTEQYNGGNVYPLEYATDGTVICVLVDTPAYVPQVRITGLYKTISSTAPNDITMNLYNYNNSSGVENINFDTTVGLSGDVPFQMDGGILTFTLDPANGTSVLSGYAIEFNPS